MPPDPPIASLAHAIQFAIAPVFLLSGIAALLGVLTTRLARIIDRSRRLEESPTPAEIADSERSTDELWVLRDRAELINRAITLCTYAALLVAGVVGTLFVGAIAEMALTWVISTAFVLAMVALIAGLTAFLREIHIATRHYREHVRRAMRAERDAE
jgi:hypothetical protein